MKLRRAIRTIRSTNAFTLIELLVVISIIALLIALLLPAIKQAKAMGELAGCLNNQRQIGVAVYAYANDNRGFFPVPPLGEFIFGSENIDVGNHYMSALIGGDDVGIWDITTAIPAERRPLAEYIEPTSEAWRCPADTGPLLWYYETPAWDGGTSSYNFNAGGGIDVAGVGPALFGATLDGIPQPSLMVMLGDWTWACTRANLPSNDLVMFTNDVTTWWHPGGFEHRIVSLAFVDGHAAYTSIQIMVPNTAEYRRNR